jgi:PqqD family protein of HPr-rel-A system
VVFDERSGDTHLLEPVAATALRALRGSPATTEELLQRVCAELGLALEPELRRSFEQLVRRLDELGLIESVHDPERPRADRAV